LEECLKLLLEQGFDPGATDAQGDCVLTLAIREKK